jgi:hypothetical protein
MPHRPLPVAYLSLLAGLCACGGGSSTGPASHVVGDASAPQDASKATADGFAGVDASARDADATAKERDGASPRDAVSTDVSSTDAAQADAISTDAGQPDVISTDAGSYRDPLLQPFATSSIWNMPIGSGAQYVAAMIKPATGQALETDDENIVLDPTAPSLDVETNTSDWSTTSSRCSPSSPLLFAAPIPASFLVPDPLPATPNSALAVLLADARTLKQTQPFARCTAGQPATSHYVFADEDLYGDGTLGAHGGSGLSAIGGSLRLGELRPNAPSPRHALKLELYAAENDYKAPQAANCFRWPAVQCDSGYTNIYGGTNPALGPGSLLALPASVSVASLGLATQPAQMLAWTLQNYGAYLVDDTGWSANAICVENGPAGTFEAQFKTDWGFAINTTGVTGAFAQDMQKLLGALAVVNNNGPTAIGGGGAPLQPLAAPLPAPP